MATSGERPGRPAGGDGRNRERILEAARDVFGSSGFREATMRSIAARAGVDVALIAHYFGSKDALFAATTGLPDEARGIVARALAAPLAEQGELLARGYLGLWENAATSAQMIALGRSALTHETAAAQLRSTLAEKLTDPAVVAGVGARRERLVLAMTHLLGVAFGRHLLRLPEVADLDFEALVSRVAPAVQLHLVADDARG